MAIALDQNGGEIHAMPEPTEGQTIILVWFAAVGTTGDTVLAYGFRDLFDKFTELNVRIIGMSWGGLDRINPWVEDHGLQFEVYSVIDRALAIQYGAATTVDQPRPAHTINIIDTESDMGTIHVHGKFATFPEEIYWKLKGKPDLGGGDVANKQWKYGFCPKGVMVDDCYHYSDAGKWVKRTSSDVAQFVFYHSDVVDERIQSAEIMGNMQTMLDQLSGDVLGMQEELDRQAEYIRMLESDLEGAHGGGM